MHDFLAVELVCVHYALPGLRRLACPSVRECRLKSDALRLTICEVDGEEPVRAIETLELHLTTLSELDS